MNENENEIIIYAEIHQLSGEVWSIGTAPFLPVFDQVTGITAVDITNFAPRPEQGWTWDGETFSPPVAVEQGE